MDRAANNAERVNGVSRNGAHCENYGASSRQADLDIVDAVDASRPLLVLFERPTLIPSDSETT